MDTQHGRTMNATAISFIALATILVGVRALAQERHVPDWVLETESSKWQPRDSQGEFVYRNRLWILGGWFNSNEAPPRDVWSSANGRDWNLATESAPWIHSDLPMSIVFQDRMWMMGGWHNGRLPGHSASNVSGRRVTESVGSKSHHPPDGRRGSLRD